MAFIKHHPLEKNYVLFIARTRKKNRYQLLNPRNNLMPRCSLELCCLVSTSCLDTMFRSLNTCLFHRSDYEEMPLQNGQAIRAKYKEESDSD